MFAGSVTGGIPGSGTDRSVTGLSTRQRTAAAEAGADCDAGGEAVAVGVAVAATGRGACARAGRLVPARGRETTVMTATTAMTARQAQPNQIRYLVNRFAGHPGRRGRPGLRMPLHIPRSRALSLLL